MAAESRCRNVAVDMPGGAARSVGLGEATRMERLAVMGALPGATKGLPLRATEDRIPCVPGRPDRGGAPKAASRGVAMLELITILIHSSRGAVQ